MGNPRYMGDGQAAHGLAHSYPFVCLKVRGGVVPSFFGDEWKLASERISIQPRAPSSGLGRVKQRWGLGSTQNTAEPAKDEKNVEIVKSVARLNLMKIEDLKGVIHTDPEIMGGTPVFAGTRVPLQNLIDYLEGGESIEDFLDGFPSVKREQVIAVIEAAKLKMLETV